MLDNIKGLVDLNDGVDSSIIVKSDKFNVSIGRLKRLASHIKLSDALIEAVYLSNVSDIFEGTNEEDVISLSIIMSGDNPNFEDVEEFVVDIVSSELEIPSHCVHVSFNDTNCKHPMLLLRSSKQFMLDDGMDDMYANEIETLKLILHEVNDAIIQFGYSKNKVLFIPTSSATEYHTVKKLIDKYKKDLDNESINVLVAPYGLEEDLWCAGKHLYQYYNDLM